MMINSAKFIKRRRDIFMYLTFHNFGRMILYPWGYDHRVDNKNEYELKRVGTMGSRAMGLSYIVGNSAKVLYPAAGGSDDWAHGEAGIPYSYTIELPGDDWFIVYRKNIRKVSEEAWRGTLSMIQSVKRF